ncbi:MAG: glycosyltransferase family protein [Bacteroidota bacterium]|nr:glycosyltransferase family protein [Bacteroidota bacterium]
MIAAIIQARTGSTRFPNKVFANLCNKPLIWHVVNRLKWSKKIDTVILATTTNPQDDTLYSWAINNNVDVYRGSENDVLGRYYSAAKKFKVDKIVRITADDPFKDPEIIDKVIELLESENLEFAYNNNPPSFPEGLDTEVFIFSAIEKAFYESKDPFEREHVTQYFYRHPELFRQKNHSYNKNISNLRWTIDTDIDFKLAEFIYSKLYKDEEIFLLNDILNILDTNPEMKQINLGVNRSAMYK